MGVSVENALRAHGGAFCKLGTAKVPKADVRVSVKAEAAPLSNEATNNFISARLSVLQLAPQSCTTVGNSPSPCVSVLITIQSKARNIQLLAVLPTSNVQRPLLAMRSRARSPWGAVDLNTCRNDQLPMMENILGYETNDRRLN